MSSILNMEVCYCEKPVIKRVYWHGDNVGRSYVKCPDDGCIYNRWIEEPLEGHASLLIDVLMKQMKDMQRIYDAQFLQLKEKYRKRRKHYEN